MQILWSFPKIFKPIKQVFSRNISVKKTKTGLKKSEEWLCYSLQKEQKPCPWTAWVDGIQGFRGFQNRLLLKIIEVLVLFLTCKEKTLKGFSCKLRLYNLGFTLFKIIWTCGVLCFLSRRAWKFQQLQINDDYKYLNTILLWF